MKFKELGLDDKTLFEILTIMIGQPNQTKSWELREEQFINQLGTYNLQGWYKDNFSVFNPPSKNVEEDGEINWNIVASRSAPGEYRFVVSKNELGNIDLEKFLLYLRLISISKAQIHPPIKIFNHNRSSEFESPAFTKQDQQAFKEKCIQLHKLLYDKIEAQKTSFNVASDQTNFNNSVNNPHSLFHSPNVSTEVVTESTNEKKNDTNQISSEPKPI